MQTRCVFKREGKNGLAFCIGYLDFTILRRFMGELRHQNKFPQNGDSFLSRSVQIGKIHPDSIPDDLIALPAVEIVLVHSVDPRGGGGSLLR